MHPSDLSRFPSKLHWTLHKKGPLLKITLYFIASDCYLSYVTYVSVFVVIGASREKLTFLHWC